MNASEGEEYRAFSAQTIRHGNITVNDVIIGRISLVGVDDVDETPPSIGMRVNADGLLFNPITEHHVHMREGSVLPGFVNPLQHSIGILSRIQAEIWNRCSKTKMNAHVITSLQLITIFATAISVLGAILGVRNQNDINKNHQ